MHPNLLDASDAFLLVVDLQETYRDKLFEWERTIDRCVRLIRAAQLLELPIVCTEQYPKGLGPTVPEVREALGPAPVLEKRSFSALGEAPVREVILASGRRRAILCGIETHACINQTAHDLLDAQCQVHVPEDAVSSRSSSDHQQGYAKMLTSGAIQGCVESILLECMRSSTHPAFRAIQGILK